VKLLQETNEMLIDVQESQMVFIDYQTKLMPALHEADMVYANALRLAKAAQCFKVPVWGTEQVPDRLGSTPVDLMSFYNKTLVKTHFSAVPDGLLDCLAPAPAAKPAGGNARSLPKHLQKPAKEAAPERRTVVLAGCEAHICLLQTALDLLDEEWDVCVVTDASTSRTERNRDAAFDRLAGAGADLVTTEMVLYEWVRHCEAPEFKLMLDLVK
jgi:nicotinamidase-related amidase